MGLLGVFIVFLAVIGVAIVRLGKVWDDARSEFIILMKLFVELAMSFDHTLVASPVQGISLLIFGWPFFVATDAARSGRPSKWLWFPWGWFSCLTRCSILGIVWGTQFFVLMHFGIVGNGTTTFGWQWNCCD